jgi:hypothetical protein
MITNSRPISQFQSLSKLNDDQKDQKSISPQTSNSIMRFVHILK